MTAGRELDALIAEKVMGWELTCPVDPRFDHSVETNRDGSSAKRNFCRWPDGREHWIPFFSTDIADAWEVVEKLSELHVVSVSCMFNKRWRCEIVQAHSQRQIPANAIADTAPLAICLAALKACGVEVDSPK